ncbi:hypothetical protein TNCV_551621 [Trichonephila clavipes]|nr:hypothetical protein TNCV_551621 [Trichonephila clavipes]
MAKSRSGRSKKRRFAGNRYTIRATINENDETSELNSTESASAKKFPYDREDERFLSYKLFNCFGAKDNREMIFSWQKLCAFLGLPFLSKLAFRNQERKLLKATELVAQENINAALSEIKGSNSFTKCGISIDEERERKEEIELAERKRKEEMEIAERKRRSDFEQKMRDMEMEFETQKKTNRVGRRRSFNNSMPRHRSVHRSRQHWKRSEIQP